MKLKSRQFRYPTNDEFDNMDDTALALFIILVNRHLEERKSDRLYEITGWRIVKGKTS